MAHESARWTVESASRWLQDLLENEPAATRIDPSLRARYLTGSSLLTHFTLDDLNFTKQSLSADDLERNLGDDLIKLPRIKGQPQFWTLKRKAREEGLRMLGELPRMWALRQEIRPSQASTIQRVFDEFLQRDYSAAADTDVERLEAASQVARWLRDFDPDIPSSASIEARLSRRCLLHPMERLTVGFVGREAELTTLRKYVGILEPRSPLEALVRHLRSRTGQRRPPLMLHGVGGVGKSTLLAEFIRQHVNGTVRFPWVYLDFDNPRLNVADLSTLIGEAVAQLTTQYPGSEWSGLLSEASRQSELGRATHYDSQRSDRTLNIGDTRLSDELRRGNVNRIAPLFASHLRRAMLVAETNPELHLAESLPLLIVLDTFEEVQKRGIETAGILWEFLGVLQREFERVRIVVSGRAQVPEVNVNGLTPSLLVLRDFDEGAAVSFLVAQGVSSPSLARSLYKQVGGSPLNLKLAAKVARLESTGPQGIEGLKTTAYFVFAAAEHVVQGQLYRRILERIPSEDLQKLAHPGLVVRRITPEIISKVLAGPCGLGEMDDERANQLFQELKRQVDLVTLEPDGALRHQQDIRRVMLKMLQDERPEQVRAINKSALDFYMPRDDDAARIEKLYHALQVGLPESEVRELWVADAAESLLSSLDELPPMSRLIVHLCTNRAPDSKLRALANLDQWEQLVEARCRQAIEYGDYRTVASLLGERKERSVGSGLYALEALLLAGSGDYEGALKKLEEGIDSAQRVNRIDRLVELWRLRGEFLERRESFPDADVSMAEAQRLAMRIGNPVVALQIFAGRARLRDRAPSLPIPFEELEAIVGQTSDSDVGATRMQLRGLFRVCGPHSLPLLFKGLRVFKLHVLPPLEHVPPWLDKAAENTRQRRLNDFLRELLENEPADASNRSIVAQVLESALDPNLAARAS